MIQELWNDIWNAWNNDPALMNAVQGGVTGFIAVIVMSWRNALRKSDAIKIEVGDVKPQVEALVAEVMTVMKCQEAVDKKLDAIADMFYTTLSNSKMGTEVKETLTKQYLAVHTQAKDVIKEVKETKSVVKEVVNTVLDNVDDIYEKFKNQA